jgi:hypothetical protein
MGDASAQAGPPLDMAFYERMIDDGIADTLICDIPGA